MATSWALEEINLTQSSLTRRKWWIRQSLETSSQSRAGMSILSPKRGRSSKTYHPWARLAIYRDRWCKRNGAWPCKRKPSRLTHLESAIMQMATARRTNLLCSKDHLNSSNIKRIRIRWLLKSMTIQNKDSKAFLNRGPRLPSSDQSLKNRPLGREKRSFRQRWSNSKCSNKYRRQPR